MCIIKIKTCSSLNLSDNAMIIFAPSTIQPNAKLDPRLGHAIDLGIHSIKGGGDGARLEDGGDACGQDGRRGLRDKDSGLFKRVEQRETADIVLKNVPAR
mmetsp:Transcript_8031/g.13011  ORF Transcript_8031/g.13011 Transcript_8031/m.13011 type:complete len:100 (-) Transcript_8031:311-610(-)